MDTNVHELWARLDTLEQRCQRAERRLKVQAGLASLTVIGALLLAPSSRTARAQTPVIIPHPVVVLPDLTARVTALEAKTQFMSANAATHATVFSGCNLFIQNGLGATNGLPGNPLSTDHTLTKTNGLGNLIIGYNESRALWGGTDTRTGSHNLILGQLQDFSSFGGLVAGACNTVSGAYASADGGDTNIASGDFSAVIGGESNTASGGNASVSGGENNIAASLFSSVSGGQLNTANGTDSAVSGGLANIAGGVGTSISGGQSNTTCNEFSAISGGFHNSATGVDASISGGAVNVQANRAGWSGGALHSP